MTTPNYEMENFIGILLILPVTYVNAQNPDIGIEVRETLYFGNWTPTSNCWNCIVEIKKVQISSRK